MTARLVILIATLGILLATYALSQPASEQADRVCMNRCEAKGWPQGCYQQCMRQWR